MILYSVIQLSSVILLQNVNKPFTNYQYFFLDGFITLFSSLLISKTGANYKLTGISDTIHIFHPKFLASCLGHILISVGMQILYFSFILAIRVNPNLNSVKDPNVNTINSVKFLFSLCFFLLDFNLKLFYLY